MKYKLNKLFTSALLLAGAITLLASCNKDVPTPEPLKTPDVSGQSIMEIINADSASLRILKAAITRSGTGVSNLLSDKTGVYTLFAPTDAAFLLSFQALGIPSSVGVNAFRPGQLDTLLRYHIIGGQKITVAMIPETFPNIQEPSLFALSAPSSAVPPGLRMSLFPSKRGTAFWVNNVPLVQTDIQAANGVIHKTAAGLLPPSQLLWDRVNADANLTYLKAAIQRADSGSVVTATLQAALSNPAANLTVFAPTNLSFQQLITAQIRAALIGMGVPDPTATAQATALASTSTVFTNPALSAVLTPTTVRGIVVYHLLGNRVFSVNIPTTGIQRPTLLNSALATHPGVNLQATFGPTGVTVATVRGLFNPSNSNIQINPTPAPGGSSDQHYVNGVLHVIDQVLRPQ